MPNWTDIQHFLDAVVPWPVDNTGHINLHYSMVTGEGKLLTGMGWPYQSIEKFLERAAWCNTMPNFKGVWFCTSRQRHAGKNSKGKPKAVRLSANIIDLKAIWTDIDVKPDDTSGDHYTTMDEALKAVFTFCKAANVPQPSAAVNSGGGLHIYWISEKAMDAGVWMSYAAGLKSLLIKHGVKCDSGLTTDGARLLRVPGTFNHKPEYPEPREVKLLPLPLRTYNFDSAFGFLRTELPAVRDQNSSPSRYCDETAFVGGPAAAFAPTTESLSTGIEQGEKLLDPQAIFTKCAFLRDALVDGGASYNEPLWNASLLCATFMEDGNAIAHKISKGHHGYTPDGTQEKYDQKVAARANGDVGYPQCSTIAGYGCKSCATCPLLAKGKSPLNIRPTITATVIPRGQQTQTAHALHLPNGYDVNDEGIICYIQERTDKKGNVLDPVYLPLFCCVLSSPWASRGPSTLNFKTTTDKGRPPQAVAIKQEEFGAMFLTSVLGKQDVKYEPDNKPRLEKFFMAWLTKLHALKAAADARPYGWYKENGNVAGFVFAGQLMRSDGTIEPAGIPDLNMVKWYNVKGSIEPWFEALRCLTNQRRPGLDALVSVAFAAPLMDMLGFASMMLCATGQSAGGKSSAFEVGLAVWGHPKHTKTATHATQVSVPLKMGLLRSLPIYWDEVKDDKARAVVYDMIFTATDGSGKDRATRDLKLQDKGSWNTMMACASNRSFVEYVIARDPSNTAGVNRVFEFGMLKPEPDAAGMISGTVAQQIIDDLRDHHGNMGMLYAQHLATNHAAIKQEVTAEAISFEQDMSSTIEERFWIPLCACLVTGAKLANSLGCDFDVPALRTFLLEENGHQRRVRDQAELATNTADSADMVLAYYLKERAGRQQIIWTDQMARGFAKDVDVVILKGVREGQVTNGVQCRFNKATAELIISRRDFHLWMKEEKNNFPVNTTQAALLKMYNGTMPKIVLCRGTTHALQREYCIILPIPPNSDLWDTLNNYSDDRPSAGAATPNPVDTGPVEPPDATV